MSDNVLIALSCGTDNTNRATRAIHLAKVAKESGKNVRVFLLDDAVYIARKGIATHMRAATGDIMDDLLVYLQEFGVPIYACTPCAKARMINEEDLIEGAEMATAFQFIEWSCESTVISL
ncbi:MAG: DsrE family protein [Desulfobulbaceae bacterium]|nr:DsrE family protein [Desulfobulbaceae bacterium]